MRLSGKTTRIVDEAVQLLFKPGKVLFFPKRSFIERNQKEKGVIDIFNKLDYERVHHKFPIIDSNWDSGISQDHMTRKFLDRLEFEHKMKCKQSFDNDGLTITVESFENPYKIKEWKL